MTNYNTTSMVCTDCTASENDFKNLKSSIFDLILKNKFNFMSEVAFVIAAKYKAVVPADRQTCFYPYARMISFIHKLKGSHLQNEIDIFYKQPELINYIDEKGIFTQPKEVKDDNIL